MRQAVGAVAPEMVKAWLVVPSGIVAILAACFGVDTLFKKFGVSFPASVACMLLLFAGLWACDAVLGNNRTRYLVALIDVPVGIFAPLNTFCKDVLYADAKTGWLVSKMDQCSLYTNLHHTATQSSDHRW